MHENQEIWVFTSLIVGFALSFLVAVVPHFSGAFRLQPLVLTAWMLPYLVLSVLAYFMRGSARLRLVLAVVGVHLVTGWIQRGVLGGTDSGLLYSVAFLTTGLLLLFFPQLLGRMEAGPMAPVLKRFTKVG